MQAILHLWIIDKNSASIWPLSPLKLLENSATLEQSVWYWHTTHHKAFKSITRMTFEMTCVSRFFNLHRWLSMFYTLCCVLRIPLLKDFLWNLDKHFLEGINDLIEHKYFLKVPETLQTTISNRPMRICSKAASMTCKCCGALVNE